MPTLVVHQGAIGDLLLSLPALRLLRKARGEYTLAANPGLGLFLRQAGEVSSVIPCTARAFSELYTGSIPPLLQYFDDIWWLTRRRGLVPDIYLNPERGITSRVIYTVDEGLEGKGCGLFQFTQVRQQLGMDDEILEDYLYPMSFSRDWRDRNLFDFAVHPGSGSNKKNWPVENFLETAGILLNDDLIKRILFIIGPAEKSLGSRIQEFVQERGGRALYMEGQELPLVADTLGATRFFLGNDSGISHLAAWCGAQSLLLFGPTRPETWKPPVSNSYILRSPARCSPCGDAYRRCDHVHCMDDIQVADAIAHLSRIMEQES